MRSTTLQRVNKHLRAAGLRPVQIWVPDTRRAGFAEECRRQSLALSGNAHEDEVLDWFAAVADKSGWNSLADGHK
jgi:hypothetical protein